jgi:hypothetical protein
LNRLGQVPAKGLPDFAVHSGLLPIDSRRLASEPVSRIDCGFRNLSSLGLLSGFQRPSRLLPAVLLCYRFTQPHRFQPAGRLLYSEPFSLSSGRCRFAFSVHREGALRCSFVGARNLLPFRSSCQLASSTRFFPPAVFCRLRDLFGLGEAASTTTAFRVNLLRRLLISLCFASLGQRLPPPVRLRLSVRGGAASIASSQGSQPPSSTPSSPLSAAVACATSPGRGGAASTTAAS